MFSVDLKVLSVLTPAMHVFGINMMQSKVKFIQLFENAL